MRVWLFACVIAVLVAAGVAAAVVVLSGGEGEEPVEREAEQSVAAEVVEAEETPQAGEPEVATPPEPVTLRYDRRQLRLPADGRGRGQRDRQLRQSIRLGRRVTRSPDGRERSAAHSLLQHGAGRGQL